MALVQTVTPDTLKQAFKDYDRDYYSYEACEALVEFFEETDCGTNTELDVIAICCDFTEADPEDIYENYSNIPDIADCLQDEQDENDETYVDVDEDKLFDTLQDYTWCVRLDNGNFLYQNF